MKIFSILGFCFLVLFHLTLQAQNILIKGVVVDKLGAVHQGVQLTINGQYSASSVRDGSFAFSLSKDDNKITKIDIQKKGYRLKNWDFDYQAKKLEVFIDLATKPILGRVIDDSGNPVVGVDIFMEEAGLSEPVITNEKGNFKIEVSEDFNINTNTKIIINGKYLDKRFFQLQGKQITVRFGKKALDLFSEKKEEHVGGEVKEILPQNHTSRQIYLKDKTGNFMQDVVIMHQQKNFTSNKNGEITIKAYNPLEVITINGFEIIQVDSTTNKAITTITLDKLDPKLAAYNADINKVINDLELEKHTLFEKSLILRNQIEDIMVKLENDEALSPEQKSKLHSQIEMLQNQLVQNDMALEDAQSKTRSTLEHFRKMLVQKDSLHHVATEKIEKIEAERVLEEERTRKNFIIFGIIIVFLSVFAIVSYRVAARIRKQKEEITKQAEDLTNLNFIISEKNQNITDSIRYAKTIQDALLPSEKILSSFFSDYFIFSKPKDIVSGDFYWFSRTEKYFFVVVADCTGHGVSGAFMSLVGNTLLNEIINEHKVYETAQIMENLHERIRFSLRQDEELNHDGMDLALCRFENLNDTEVELIFTGAKRPFYLIFQDEAHCKTIRGDAKSLGGNSKKEKSFSRQAFVLKTGDMIYMCSDGLIDQCNSKREKFGSKRFVSMLENNSKLDFSIQKKRIAQELVSFGEHTDQRDDMLLLGVKI